MSDIKVSILKMPQGLGNWNLVRSFMVLRKDVFISRKKWNLVSEEDIEFEQYDRIGYQTYIIAHKDGQALAGCRLIRCDSQFDISSGLPGYTYMINDAYHRRINLSSDICSDPPPTTPDKWELTRLAAKPGNSKAVLMVMDAAYTFLAAKQAVGCLCLASPAIQRIARLSGYKTVPIGPICYADDEERFLAFEIPVQPLNID